MDNKKNGKKKIITIATICLVALLIVGVVALISSKDNKVVEVSKDNTTSESSAVTSEAGLSSDNSTYTSDDADTSGNTDISEDNSEVSDVDVSADESVNTSENTDISEDNSEISETDISSGDPANTSEDVNTSDPVNTSSEESHEHIYKTSVVEATCEKDGYTLHKCEICGDSYKTDKVKATGHTYGEWVVKVAATETTEGYKERVCSVCGKEETEKIANTGGYTWNVYKYVNDEYGNQIEWSANELATHYYLYDSTKSNCLVQLSDFRSIRETDPDAFESNPTNSLDISYNPKTNMLHLVWDDVSDEHFDIEYPYSKGLTVSLCDVNDPKKPYSSMGYRFSIMG